MPVSLPEAPLSPAEDWAQQVLADHVGDPTYAEFVAAVDDLEPHQQIELVALMWLGRGDFELDEWSDAVETATEERTARTADYLITTPLLPDYLQDGLALLGYESE